MIDLWNLQGSACLVVSCQLNLIEKAIFFVDKRWRVQSLNVKQAREKKTLKMQPLEIYVEQVKV